MRWIRWSIVLVSLTLVVAPFTSEVGSLQLPETKAPPPVVLPAEQDHQRMMKLLGITALRSVANPNDPQAPNAVNYDEAKANPYPNLPDPLVLKNGRRVMTAKVWWTKRRPEIVEDFDREIYGRVPKVMPEVKWEVIATTREMNGDVPVITKKLVGHVDNSSYPPVKVDIRLARRRIRVMPRGVQLEPEPGARPSPSSACR
jgi:hypothetical protein